MKPESSLPHSQQPATCPCPEPDQSCPYAILLLKIQFDITLPSSPDLPSGLFPSGLPTKPCRHLSWLPYITRHKTIPVIPVSFAPESAVNFSKPRTGLDTRGSPCEICGKTGCGASCEICGKTACGTSCEICGKTGCGTGCETCGKTGYGESCEICGKTGCGTSCEICGKTGCGASCEICGKNWLWDKLWDLWKNWLWDRLWDLWKNWLWDKLFLVIWFSPVVLHCD